jgi:hypothetical protein
MERSGWNGSGAPSNGYSGPTATALRNLSSRSFIVFIPLTVKEILNEQIARGTRARLFGRWDSALGRGVTLCAEAPTFSRTLLFGHPPGPAGDKECWPVYP